MPSTWAYITTVEVSIYIILGPSVFSLSFSHIFAWINLAQSLMHLNNTYNFFWCKITYCFCHIYWTPESVFFFFLPVNEVSFRWTPVCDVARIDSHCRVMEEKLILAVQLSELFSTTLNISRENRRNKVSIEAGIPALHPGALTRVVQHLFFFLP